MFQFAKKPQKVPEFLRSNIFWGGFFVLAVFGFLVFFFPLFHQAFSQIVIMIWFSGILEKKKKKKQVIAIGKKTACAVELHPVEVTYNTPSTLLFCRYDNALRTHWDACI